MCDDRFFKTRHSSLESYHRVIITPLSSACSFFELFAQMLKDTPLEFVFTGTPKNVLTKRGE